MVVVSSGKIPPTWVESKIVLIPKAGRISSLPQSYRPIALLNVDYIVLASILTAWLSLIISDYIHPVQSGFIKGRYLRGNIRCAMKIIDFAQIRNEQVLLFFLQMQKKHSIVWIASL